MNEEKPNNNYFINYSNYPILVNFNNSANAWIINRKHLSKSKAKELLINEPKQVDVSNLQWYQQINLDKVFNL